MLDLFELKSVTGY